MCHFNYALGLTKRVVTAALVTCDRYVDSGYVTQSCHINREHAKYGEVESPQKVNLPISTQYFNICGSNLIAFI